MPRPNVAAVRYDTDRATPATTTATGDASPRLRAEDVTRALEGVDPVVALELDLISGPTVPAPAAGPDTGDGGTPPAGNVPVEHLRSATYAALAARHLLDPGVVTAAVIGSGPAATVLLAVLADHLHNVTHVALCPEPDLDAVPLDLLDAHGISTTVTKDVTDAVFGANLVVVAGDVADLDPRALVPGAVLVNVGHTPLARVAAAARHIVVDERPSPDGLTGDRAARAATWTDRRVVELQQLLTGERRCRAAASDELVLVELVGGRELDSTFHQLLRRVAARRENDTTQQRERGES